MSEALPAVPRFRIIRTKPIGHCEATPSWYVIDREFVVAYPMPNWKTAVEKAYAPEKLEASYTTNFPLKTLLENRQ